MSTQSRSWKAIFPIYASQDAEAARRIANALRERGIDTYLGPAN
jgi:hypothetical protein